MARQPAITLRKAQRALRKDVESFVENISGWCVYVGSEGERQYVVDDDDFSPIEYTKIAHVFSRNERDSSSPKLFI